KAIQSFYKIVSRKQVEQISQVDYKANILITLCSLLASIVGSIFLVQYEMYKEFTPAVIILTLFSVTSIFLSMLVIVSPTCPKTEEEQTDMSVINFNRFSKLDLKSYRKAVKKTLKSEDRTYEALNDDLYYTGKILKQKYMFIGWAYRVFLSGIIIAFLWGLFTKVI
ncbi:MAG: Pycsar system effector family protein, partial [Bacteroidota bacterium]